MHDPRVQASCDHSLLDILVILVLGVACGAEDFTDLELFGRKRESWLRTFLKLPGGIPSHDTFRRVLSLLEPKAFFRRVVSNGRRHCTRRPAGS